MRLTLIVLLCLLNAGCAIWRRDKEEPVENTGPVAKKVEPVLKPSEALQPKSHTLASPVSDQFYVRGTYFPASVTTTLQLSPSAAVEGSTLIAEDDLGLDDQVDQGRMEFDIRLRENNHFRVDYFKLSRFREQPLARSIIFGDFIFEEGTNFRSKLDWRVLSMTYSYSFVHTERFEGGLGVGIHLIEAHAEGREPGTLNREKADEIGIFPTIAANLAFRISKRWSITARGQQFSANPEDFEGKMADYHGDLQYRWRRNFAIGLGYTKLETDLKVLDADQPLLFNLDTSGPEIFFRASF
ncbi:MAG TPA: hypothetical protein VFP37_04640 [Steroidobacteraceae bacterium]|nr:hypothetical protein [Steroidobacteraceae bacterium]